MLYLFHGSDTSSVRSKAFAWVLATRTKVPDAFYSRIDADSLTEEALSEALGTQGLFFSKTLLLLDDPFSKITTAEIVLERIQELADSPNVIAIIAPKLLAGRLKKIEGHATKVFVVDKKAVVARGFNGNLVNALAQKNGPMLWKEIVRAYRQGDAPELVHGLLHWKARDMMQKGSSAWRGEEARKLSVSLIKLVSDSRGKSLPLGPALERFALSL
jgi:hypothetical protein